MTGDDHLKRLYYSRDEMRGLLLAIVGIFDHSEIQTVRKLKIGKPSMERTPVMSADLVKLINELDQLFPGIFDDYVNYRLESQAVRKYGKR